MGIKKILEDRIQVVEKVESWEKAIEVGAFPLVKDKKIKFNYIENMIKNIEELGPYIILIPGVAMPHARPDENVLESSISLLKVNEGVKFSENTDKVYLMFCLAAKDSSSHIEIIEKLMEVLSDEEKIEKLIKAKTKEELKSFL
ncbi:PTS sugar transporter subunit IIA [Fusobacterium mortiferum]|jgi:mannitol/fructose-specific phosphotransferase system IIA component (Ntr-type)|uniref:Ascorbate-specific PTS system EIIA component n=1 Tax=Fusobacterium mortiferum TaxID=850 RepID=A0ABS2G5J4_FUSMR|nr:PTS sugar transporter subunit IIA [Fusobacterium mortiferum]MBM6822528.1 PTS sugar transporter subunit IIA [Fusobacterium mortiferum]MBM6875843.1 PTS sugar transporter subunit IIA [Fusobacterium mortiferum]